MSKYNVNKGINVFAKVLTVIIAVLLIFGILGGVVYLLNRPQGMYIEYDGITYDSTSASNGISVPFKGGNTVTFTIGNTDD